MYDKFHEECGVFGVDGHPDAANLTYLGLYALQHRGQESAGIVSTDGKLLASQRDMGLVADIFTEERIKRLPGHAAIGHNRYSTTGDSISINIQPILVNFALGGLAVAHNGNLVNAGLLKAELEAYGSIFQSTMDSEVVIHLIAQSRMATLHERIVDALLGAFAREWSKYDCDHAVFRPKLMEPEVLEEGARWAIAEFYSRASVISRFTSNWRHPLIFSMMNSSYRTKNKEILQPGARP